jgi:hypothetical protein
MQSGRWTKALDQPGIDYSYQAAIEAWLESFVFVAPTLKQKAFHEEREWRLISDPISGIDPRWKVRPGRSMLIPYIASDLAAVGSQIPVKDIVVGPTPHMELACMAVGDWVNAKGMHDCTVRKSKVPYRNW